MKRIFFLLVCFGTVSVVKAGGHHAGTANEKSEFIVEQELPQPFAGPETPVLYALEATQVIQDWNNSIHLIAHKTTLVRAFIQLAQGSTNFKYSADKIPRLLGKLNGGGAPLSPLDAANIDQFVLLPYTTDDNEKKRRRKEINYSLNFELPDSWLGAGTLELSLEGAGGPKVFCEELDGPSGAPNDCKTTVELKTSQPLIVEFYRFSWRATGGDLVPPPSADEGTRVKERILAMFPTDKISLPSRAWDVRNEVKSIPLTIPYPPYWPVHKVILRELSAIKRDNKASFDANEDAYSYMGLVKGPPVPVRDAIGLTSGEAGKKNSSVHVDYFGPESHEMAHQFAIGHVKGVSGCGEGTPLENDFPKTVNKHEGDPGRFNNMPTIGPMAQGIQKLIYGYNSHGTNENNEPKVLSPYEHFEMMSYCPTLLAGTTTETDNGWKNAQPSWPSDFMYKKLYSVLNNGQTLKTNEAAHQTATAYRVFSGLVNISGNTAQFFPAHLSQAVFTPATMPAGDYQLQLFDGQNNLLSTVNFAPEIFDDNAGNAEGYFYIPVTLTLPAKKAVVVKNNAVLGQIIASNSVPSVQLLSPNGGGTFTGSVNWQGSDADGDQLTYKIQISKDGGTRWKTLSLPLTSQTYQFDPGMIGAASNVLFRILVSDGFNVAMDESDAVFSTSNSAPVVSIVLPSDSSVYVGGASVLLRGNAQDLEDGELTGTKLSWSSNLNGILGTGAELTRKANLLQQGEHVIKLTATDANGATATDSIRIKVVYSGNTLVVSPKVFLQGPYMTANSMMVDSLRTKSLLPESEPYPALGFVPTSNTFNSRVNGGLFDSTGIKGIVDWVWLELRNASNPIQVVATRAALVRRDGNVVAMDGASPVGFLGLANGNYYVALRHRNHLGVMTASPVALNGTTAANINFTSPSTATYGTNARKNISGVMVLWAGDVNGDGVVRYTGANNDKDALLTFVGLATPSRVLGLYHRSDLNLNGQNRYVGPFNDKDVILNAVGLANPTTIITEQIPK